MIFSLKLSGGPVKKGRAPVWLGALPNISLVRYGTAVFKNAGEHP
tara:strand:+ start:158 stop:292 length:135 start_codon:yes stop_codon:yes gene_type:complete